MSFFHEEAVEWREAVLAEECNVRRDIIEGERTDVAEARREAEADRSRSAAPARPMGTPNAGPDMRVRGGTRSLDRNPSRTMCDR